jgi:hypothetical protein
MERKIKGNHLMQTFWSLAEYTDYSAAHAQESKAIRNSRNNEYFTHVESFDAAVKLARSGWSEELPAALALAESAVETADDEHMMDSFNQPIWDVTGAQVDVGAFLAGTPECMIDYPLSTTSKVGRVVTLVVSMSASAAIEADTLVRRGQVIVALALALSKLGHACEIWADCSTTGSSLRSCDRVLVKGSGDEIDPSSLMFALAHPAMLRCLEFGVKDGYPSKFERAMGYAGYGTPAGRTEADKEQYPEGTIFLPQLYSGSDIPDADTFLRKYLGELGLLAE